MMQKDTKRLSYGLEEVSEMIGVSKSFLRLEVSRGRLEVLRLGRRVVVRAGEIERYLSDRET